MLKRKKKTKFRKPTVPPQYSPPPMPSVKPPNKGSNVQPKKTSCTYETPCGWCTKWDKKCDKKINHKKDKDLEDIKSGKGLASVCVFREPWQSIVP